MERSRRAERLYQHVGQRVREFRRSLQLTQEVLAKQVGTSRTTITNLELGDQHVPLHQLLAIAEELQVELRDLIPTRADLAKVDDYIPGAVKTGGPQEPPPQTARFISDLLKRS
jgi:transcriptional regulator with XRE-family HTH domain